jgi:hypothetical protein
LAGLVVTSSTALGQEAVESNSTWLIAKQLTEVVGKPDAIHARVLYVADLLEDLRNELGVAEAVRLPPKPINNH